MANLFAKKTLELILKESSETGEHTLKRTLGSAALLALGIGAIIGAGIFVRTAAAAGNHAGPGVMWSYVIAGIGCAFAGLCYVEFASMIPLLAVLTHIHMLPWASLLPGLSAGI